MTRQTKTENQVAYLQRIALALARDATLFEMSEIVTRECRLALDADAVCTYLLNEDDWLEMIAEFGCTPEFKRDWAKVPRTRFPLNTYPPSVGEIYLGSAADFTKKFPMARELVILSGRRRIGYCPLAVNNRMIGLFGFSYNREFQTPEDQSFISLLMNLCSQALERARLSEAEKAANRAKSEFLANISHEVRTPLGLIQGYTELLSEGDGLSKEQKNWAAIVHRNTRQLVDLIGEVLDISKIEAAKVEVHAKYFDLAPLLQDVYEAALLKAKEKNIELNVSYDNLPSQVQTDPTRLRQILFNLVGNSIKFTQNGSVQVKIKMTSPTLLQVEVIDTGIGIPREHHDRIFEPFTQVDSSTRRNFGGTGLGLPISRALARALGGDLVLISSAPGVGSYFRLYIKCDTRALVSVPHAKSGNIEVACPFGGARILVVEDSLENQELIRQLLIRQGAKVDQAISGAEGVKKALAKTYDAILMDIQMPEMDGNQAVKLLRQKKYSGVIVALTAHALTVERERSLASGFDDYLTKPIDSRTLVQTLKRLMITWSQIRASRPANHINLL